MELWLLIGIVVIFYYAIKAMTASSKEQVRKHNISNSENETRVTRTTSNRVIANNNRDNDDDLATFRISYGYEEVRISGSSGQ